MVKDIIKDIVVSLISAILGKALTLAEKLERGEISFLQFRKTLLDFGNDKRRELLEIIDGRKDALSVRSTRNDKVS